MNYKALLGLIAMLFLINISRSADDPIGYEYVGNYLHTWNQNPFEDRRNIYQDVNYGYLQFHNNISHTGWLTHRFGLAYYNPNGAFRLFSKNQINNQSHHITSDNSTQWTQHLWKCLNKSTPNNKREFCVGWKRGQHLTATYMKNHFFFSVNSTQAPFTFNKPIWYVWGFENISIENDNTPDEVVYCNLTGVEDNGSTSYFERCDAYDPLENSTFERDNLTQFSILDTKTGRGHIVLWNDTNMRLRHEPENPMLLTAVNNGLPLINWSGTDKTKMWWIDYKDFFNISVDATNEVSGWIRRTGATYFVFNNSDTVTGFDSRFIGDREWRAYHGFNASLIPKNAVIESIRFWVQPTNAQSIDNGPANWITDFWVCGDGCISDGNGLKTDDWTDGNDTTRTVDWDSDPETSVNCGANQPCETWVTIYHNETDFGNTVARDELYTAMKNDEWYHVILIDDSSYTAGQYWDHVLNVKTDVANKIPIKLEVNYSIPEINMTLLNPQNDTSFPEGATLNFTWDANASLGLDSCNITINESLYQLNTTSVYQEVSNRSRCFGNWDPSQPCTNTNDSNWFTFGQANIFSTSTIHWNYTKPANARKRPLWMIKDTAAVNLTIPNNCWDFNQSTLTLAATSSRSITTYTRWFCKQEVGSQDWLILKNLNLGSRIYEDAMYWIISADTNYSQEFNTPGTYNWTVRCNDSIGNSNVSETWFFDITAPVEEGVNQIQSKETKQQYPLIVLAGMIFVATLIGRKNEKEKEGIQEKELRAD